MREKCPNMEFSWSVFSRIRTEYGEKTSPNAGKYGPEKTPYLDTFQAMYMTERCNCRFFLRETF